MCFVGFKGWSLLSNFSAHKACFGCFPIKLRIQLHREYKLRGINRFYYSFWYLFWRSKVFKNKYDHLSTKQCSLRISLNITLTAKLRWANAFAQWVFEVGRRRSGRSRKKKFGRILRGLLQRCGRKYFVKGYRLIKNLKKTMRCVIYLEKAI